jgi:hypothetical protein
MPRSLVIAAIGVCVAVYAVWHYYGQLGAIQSWLHTSGTIAGRVSETVDTKKGKRRITYLRVRYKDGAGNEQTARVPVAKDAGYADGGAVKITYNPAKPDQAVLGGFWTFKGMPITFGVIGILVFLFGTGQFLIEGRRARSA